MMDIFIKLDKGPGMWSSCLESPKINPSTYKQGSTKERAGNRRTGTARPSFRHHTVGSGTHESLPQENKTTKPTLYNVDLRLQSCPWEMLTNF